MNDECDSIEESTQSEKMSDIDKIIKKIPQNLVTLNTLQINSKTFYLS